MDKKASLLLILLLLITAGCDLADSFNQPEAEGIPPAVTESETAVATELPDAEATPDIAIPTTPVTETQPTLRVWLPPEIALATENGAAILNAQLAAFRSNHPDLMLTIEQKSVSGQSGILNYLRTGRTVAPSILPDLIAIPTEQVSLAMAEELIYPLDGLLETSLLEELYPAALDLAFEESQIAGYPFILTGLPHLAFNSDVVTDTISSRWNLFAEQPYSFVFPANGNAGGTLGLQLYLAAGGTLTNEAGQATLQLEPLTAALEQLFIAENIGLILDQSSNYATFQETWPLLQVGTASVALTNGEQYLSQRDAENVFQATAVPGIGGQLPPVVSGWVWALSSSEPVQQELATELLSTLIASNNLGEWSYASGYLPAQRTAFATWPDTDSYKPFAESQLSQAIPLPISNGGNMMTVLNNAVFDVITLAKTPQAAAEEAVAALQQ